MPALWTSCRLSAFYRRQRLIQAARSSKGFPNYTIMRQHLINHCEPASNTAIIHFSLAERSEAPRMPLSQCPHLYPEFTGRGEGIVRATDGDAGNAVQKCQNQARYLTKRKCRGRPMCLPFGWAGVKSAHPNKLILSP